MSWINGIRGLVSSDELAKDVTGAEALLERHQVSSTAPCGLTSISAHEWVMMSPIVLNGVEPHKT